MCFICVGVTYKCKNYLDEHFDIIDIIFMSPVKDRKAVALFAKYISNN